MKKNKSKKIKSVRGIILQTMIILFLSIIISLIAFYTIGTEVFVRRYEPAYFNILENDNILNIPEAILIDNNISIDIIDSELNVTQSRGFRSTQTEQYTFEKIVEMVSNNSLGSSDFENIFFEIKIIENEDKENNFALITTYYNQDDNKEIIGNIVFFFIFIALGSIGIIIALFYFNVNGLNKQIISSFNLISENIKKTPYNREKIEYKDIKIAETQEVAKNYNQMIDEMNRMKRDNDELAKNSNRLISNLSHDLKSPITTLKGYSEILLDDKNLTDDAKKYASYINESTKDLDNMINVLFDQIKFKDSDFHLALETQDINEFLRNICAQYYKIFESKGFNFDFSIEEDPFYFNFDPVNLKRAFINLLENIHTHNPSGTFVIITSESFDDHFQICFKDNGIEIPSDEAGKIFDPFFKVDKSRQTRSNGLGLFSSKQIIEKHNGKIIFRKEDAYNTVFEVIFYN